MVEDIDPNMTGVTTLWANKDTLDAQVELASYIMFSHLDLINNTTRRSAGGILYIKNWKIYHIMDGFERRKEDETLVVYWLLGTAQ